jgi:hypothetical protein
MSFYIDQRLYQGVLLVAHLGEIGRRVFLKKARAETSRHVRNATSFVRIAP